MPVSLATYVVFDCIEDERHDYDDDDDYDDDNDGLTHYYQYGYEISCKRYYNNENECISIVYRQ